MTGDSSALLDRAIKAGRSRKYADAIRFLTTLLARTDDAPEALLYLGRSYHAIGDFGKAASTFRIYLDRVGGSVEGYLFLGRSYLAMGSPEDAVQPLREALRLAPDSATVEGMLGLCFLKLRRSSLAIKHLERAIGLQPDNKRLYVAYLNALLVGGIKAVRRGDSDIGRQMLSFFLSNGGELPVARLYLAHAYRAVGMHQEAIAEYDRVIESGGEDPTIAWYRTATLLEAGRTEEAFEGIAYLKTRYPDLPDLDWNPMLLSRALVWNLFKAERFADAALAARSYIKEFGHDSATHALMGECYRVTGNYEYSRNHYNLALKDEPDNEGYHYGLVMALWELGEYAQMRDELLRLKGRAEDPSVIEYYECLCLTRLEHEPKALVERVQGLLRVYPGDPHLMRELGYLYIETGLPGLAIGWFEKVLGLLPEDGRAALGLVRAADEAAEDSLDGPEKSLKAYEAFLESFEDSGGVRRSYAKLLMKHGDFAKAALQLELILPQERSPKARGATLRALALCYRNSKKYPEAAVIYRDLLRKAPNNVELLKSLVYCLDRAKSYAWAIALMESAKKVFKKDPDMQLMLGILYFRSKQVEKSLDAFRAALDIAPKDYRAYRNIAEVYKAQKIDELAQRYSSQADELEKLAKKTPSHPI
jgi:tetratricopeptide (TPR) repeat protein